MTDQEYVKFLTALAAKHVYPRGIPEPDKLERLHDKMKNLIQISRQVQDLRAELTERRQRGDGGPPKELLYKLSEAPVFDGFDAMDDLGILEALDDAQDAVFTNLRRSAIPDEDVQFLSRAGIENPELEITITIEYAKRRMGSWREGARELQDIRHIKPEMAGRLDKAYSTPPKDPETPPKKRKILNGIGKILGGAIAGTGNVLLLCGTIMAPNPATGAGAIASAAIAVASVMQGAGDLRGE